jgi:translation initiation factor 5A
MVKKSKAQVLSVSGDEANLMDAESFENLELPIPEELKGEVKDGGEVEYWDIEGVKLIKRVF